MINRLKYATINDIKVSNLMYYSEETIDDLIQFCQINRISYVPSKDKKTIYKLIRGEFIPQKDLREFSVNPFDRLFDPSTLKKFQNVDHNEIRFVVEKGKIKGVVHIIDYNNEFLQVEFFRALYRFENYVRQLLIQNGLTNNDFISWVQECSETDPKDENRKHWEKRLNQLLPKESKEFKKVDAKRRDANPFQTFYLKELVQFAIARNLIDKKQIHLDEVASLRNSIAHNKDFTSTTELEDGQLVYNFINLQSFVMKANMFFEAYEYLEERISL